MEIEKAIALAATAHHGQLDKLGNPFIFHPLRVMLACATTEAQIVAVLHDVVEKTSVTLDHLREEGLAPDLLAAVDALTRRSHETDEDFVLRAARYDLSRQVKLADLQDNLEQAKSAGTDPTKYSEALELIGALPPDLDDRAK